MGLSCLARKSNTNILRLKPSDIQTIRFLTTLENMIRYFNRPRTSTTIHHNICYNYSLCPYNCVGVEISSHNKSCSSNFKLLQISSNHSGKITGEQKMKGFFFYYLIRKVFIDIAALMLLMLSLIKLKIPNERDYLQNLIMINVFVFYQIPSRSLSFIFCIENRGIVVSNERNP